MKYADLYLAAAHPRAEYMREYMKNRYHSKRKAIYDHLGGKCSRCGDKKGPFHLDHKDKRKKTMRASDLHSVNDQKFKDEIKNLQLLCEKCHRDKTKESWDYSTPKPRHGTYWMYRKHGCRCKKCTKAYKEKQKEWRENRKKKADDMTAIDTGKNIVISPALIDELLASIERTENHISEKRTEIQEAGEAVPETDIESIRDFSGNLALLCNMILNGKSYSEEEKQKAILDL